MIPADRRCSRSLPCAGPAIGRSVVVTLPAADARQLLGVLAGLLEQHSGTIDERCAVLATSYQLATGLRGAS